MNTGTSFRRTLDVYPQLGMVTQIPARNLPLGASPDMLNMCLVGGRLRKRPGYTQLATGNAAFSSSVTGLFSVQDEENGTHLFAFTHTELKKYNTATDDWDTMTGPAFTGGADDLFTHEVSQNVLVASQGLDAVIAMPFTGTTYAALDAGAVPARYMTRAADRLLLANTLESAARKPFRVRRPVAGDHTDWAGVGAGFTDVNEFPYHIRNIRKIGTRVAVYTEKAIIIGTRTGDASRPLVFEPIVTESGLYAPHTLRGRKNLHMYLGTDDVYEFNGSAVLGVSAPVQYDIYQSLNAASADRMFGEVLNDTQEYLLFLCTGAATTPDRVWVYNWGRQIWYPWDVDGPQCSTLHRSDSSQTWNGIGTTWDSYPIEWDSYTLQASYPGLLTGHDDGKVYIWGLNSFSDNGQAIRCYWTSKDFHAEDVDPQFNGKQITLRSVTVWYRSAGVAFSLDFYYSSDGGASWEGPYTESVAATSGGDHSFTTDRQVSGSTVRFRIEQSSATAGLIINSLHPEIEVRDAPARTA